MEAMDPQADWKQRGSAGAESRADRGRIALTFGSYNQTTPWTDIRSLMWPALVDVVSGHRTGPKEGTCIVPATFRGTERKKEHADKIDVVFLDSDSGASLQEIRAALTALGWRGIISSTHSHGSSRTRVKRLHWAKFLATADDPVVAAEQYLVQEKGYLPRVAMNAHIVEEGDEHITFQHEPCPKFRIIVPLARPWRASDFPTQGVANAAWKERIEAVAAALGLNHDQSCTDTSRLFYLPRRPIDGPLPEIAILDGTPCDIFELPIARSQSRREKARRGSAAKPGSTDEFLYLGSDGAEQDLHDWAREHAHRFEIAAALKARRPGAFIDLVTDTHKHHMRCPNEEAHTQAGEDHATFCMNSSASSSRGFVIHCRHGHCDGRDRLLFLRQMLEQGWLTVEDLFDSAFRSPEDPTLPVIRSKPGAIVEVVDAAEQALIGASSGIYQRGHFLVRPAIVTVAIRNNQTVNAQHIVEVGDHALAEAMSAAARWEKWDGRSNKPVAIDAPLKVAITYKQRIGRWRLSPLIGIINAPTLRFDGSILEVPGYDPMTGLLLDTAGASFPCIPPRPCKVDALVALQVLEDLLIGFPFVNDVSRSVALSGLLTACIRRSLTTAPLHAYTAPTPGSGKSLLVDLACLIAAGREAGVLSQGRTSEELEKRLSAALLAGDPVIAIDNCDEPLGGDFLCAMLTQTIVRARILGRSEAPELPSNSFVTATGNNLRLVGDMSRRAVLCQLDAKIERPELRTFSSVPDAMIKTDRPKYLIAALTILRAYHVAGRPNRPDPLASYSDWSAWVRGALIWLGKADPVNSVEEVRSLDPARNGLMAVVAQWETVVGTGAVTAGDLIDIACSRKSALGDVAQGAHQYEFAHPELREALLEVAGSKGNINNVRLGKWLASNKDRLVEGCRIVCDGVSRGLTRWRLESAPAGSGHV